MKRRCGLTATAGVAVALAPPADKQKRITRDFHDVRYVPPGAHSQPFAYGREVSDVLNSFAVVYTVERA